MNKLWLFFFLCFFQIISFACPNAQPTNDGRFCASFKAAAICYCTAWGVPAGACQDMKTIHQRMITYFGSLQRACEHQRYTASQICIDNWNCYLKGGTDSKGKACSGTRLSCE